MDLVLTTVAKLLAGILNRLPLNLRIVTATWLLKAFFVLLPSHLRVADTNIMLAFSENDARWRNNVKNHQPRHLARVLVDALRLPTLSREWFLKHVQFDDISLFQKLQEQNPNRPFLVVTGHLGSFELLAHAAAVYGFPVHAIARRFSMPRMDRWWNGIRERWGIKIIDRKGGFKKLMKSLRDGHNVAVLLDQNAKRSDAVFVDFFGTLAATSKIVGIAALRQSPILVVASVMNLPNDHYRINAKIINYEDIESSSDTTADKKIYEITQRVTKCYEGMIREQPEAWFWVHRRWRTRPTEDAPKIY